MRLAPPHDETTPWHVGMSWHSTLYAFADRGEAERMAASLNDIENRSHTRAEWSVRHHSEIALAKLAAEAQQKAS